MNLKERGLREETDSSEHLLWIVIAKPAYLKSGYGGAESGEEYHIIGMVVGDVLRSFLVLYLYRGR